jgi:hypothetical protein
MKTWKHQLNCFGLLLFGFTFTAFAIIWAIKQMDNLQWFLAFGVGSLFFSLVTVSEQLRRLEAKLGDDPQAGTTVPDKQT